MFTERSEPVMLISCWYICFPVSRALWFAIRFRCSVKSPFGIISISCDLLYDCVTRALLLFSFPVLSAFTLISAQSAIFGISHATRAAARDNTRMRN